MIKKFGFIKSLNFDQLSYFMVKSLNDYYGQVKSFANMGQFTDYVVFSDIPLPSHDSQRSFGIYHFSEMFEYNGPIMACDVFGADYLMNIPSSHKKYFYVWDLDWTRRNPKSWDEFAKVYQNPQLNLICRSDDHARAVESAWNVKVHSVMKEFNLEDVKKLCS